MDHETRMAREQEKDDAEYGIKVVAFVGAMGALAVGASGGFNHETGPAESTPVATETVTPIEAVVPDSEMDKYGLSVDSDGNITVDVANPIFRDGLESYLEQNSEQEDAPPVDNPELREDGSYKIEPIDGIPVDGESD